MTVEEKTNEVLAIKAQLKEHLLQKKALEEQHRVIREADAVLREKLKALNLELRAMRVEAKIASKTEAVAKAKEAAEKLGIKVVGRKRNAADELEKLAAAAHRSEEAAEEPETEVNLDNLKSELDIF